MKLRRTFRNSRICSDTSNQFEQERTVPYSPAEFLVDSKGTIVWENLTENLRVRARPGIILEAIDKLLGKEGR
jgi:hypothetical protein